ncbi:hypothetical protein [Nocardioides aequoreus]|uniref:hypothetical protein n=1 Tax=Nocardioides aequoreus TaxID=397278 RepID=UPI0004C414BF|nr:hypothetical protein [Nocardioides aequoreus]
MSEGPSVGGELAASQPDPEIYAVEGSRFENDEDMLLDMFLGDFDEVDDLRQLRDWVAARGAGRRKRRLVSNETKLEVFPTSGTVRISGRWNRDWGEKSMSLQDFVELCNALIARGHPDG